MWRAVHPEMPCLGCSVFSPVLTRRVSLLVVLSCLIFFHCMQCARSRKQPPGIEILDSGPSSRVIQKVLTTDGKECKFPFRFGGTIHGQCIPMSSSRNWCSLTHNFDRDQQWGFCSPGTQLFNGFFPPRRDPGLCRQNPCLNGGVCSTGAHLQSFECVCQDGFTGALCEQKKCYELLHLKYYDIGQSWGRIYLRNVELCTCLAGGVTCTRAHYTVCSSNRCENDGVCRMIEATGEEVCGCTQGYTGQYCNIKPEEQCYHDSGVQYRGIAKATVSGSSCLPWNSDLLFNELTVDTVDSASLRGLGEHSFCRNPDHDKLPWCYTMTDRAISWEYCDIPRCFKNHPPGKALTYPHHCAHPALLAGHQCVVRGMRSGRFEGVSLEGHLHSPALTPGWQHCTSVKSSVRAAWFPPAGSCQRLTAFCAILVKLKKANGRCAQKTQFIRPICLPGKDTVFPDHSCCKITGWGHMHEKANSYSHLQEGVVKIIPFERCSSPEVYGANVRSGMLCAGSDSCVDACQGDSGGPLACECDGVSFLYGIISWGDGCGRTGKPGVYTLVPKYSDWINSILKSHRRNTSPNTLANRTQT